jgi:alpha-1,6-mannosyltransferase
MTADWSSRPAVLRYLGLAGSVSCAVVAVLGGAPTLVPLGVSAVSVWRGPHGPLVLTLWVAGLAALCAAWWYGRRLAEAGVLGTRWILVTAALWVLPLVAVPPLGSRDMYSYACQGALYDAGLNPYLVGVSAQPCPWLDSVSLVWRDTPTPYGPLWIMMAGFASSFGSQIVALVLFRLLAVVSTLTMAAAVTALVRRAGAPVERGLWLALASPLVAVHVVGGGHNDALSVTFLAAGLALLAGTPVGRGAAASAERGAGRAGGAVPAAGAGPVDAAVPVSPVAAGGATAAGPARAAPAPDAGRARGYGVLVVAGMLLGAAAAVKTTMGVVLPFAAVLAAGGFPPTSAGWSRLLRRGGAVAAGALATLAALSIVSGLGFGWLLALSGAGEARGWTSPSTAVGITVNAVAKWFGVRIDVVPALQVVAVVLLLAALVAIWWRFRLRDQLHGAALALLAVIAFAPITQPWYLVWVLALLAATRVRLRWLEAVVVASMFLVLPTGDTAWRPLQVPFAFAMTGLVGWLAYRGYTRLRGRDPAERRVAVP